ncbi:DUF6520 family protein [Gelidibacter pelagius]|uniref:Uncharacterized protein n=1 Tax=Gelidibacter pelagius TaxID=2819985 RepID=A0ABS3SX43_9FLAO|nr:DUF6520 family protein [Gelidibacter pelagius]MBO3100271.1 hypothetical protein [Gelidibacter pelagius]
MKSKILKMVLPAFVLMLAVVSAFAFESAQEKTLLAPETGWINLPDLPCAVEVKCDNTIKPFMCTTVHTDGNTYQAFGKYGSEDSPCIKPLYRLD